MGWMGRVRQMDGWINMLIHGAVKQRERRENASEKQTFKAECRTTPTLIPVHMMMDNIREYDDTT